MTKLRKRKCEAGFTEWGSRVTPDGGRTAIPQDSDGGRTAIPQDSDGGRTAIPQDSDGGRVVIPQDNNDWRAAIPWDSDDHCREKEPRKVNQNWQRHKGKILWVIILGISISLLVIWLTVQHGSPPVWTPDNTRGADLVTVHTRFTPLLPSAFISFLDSEESRKSLYGVLSWKVASVSWSWMQCQAFAALLPERGSTEMPGYVWTLLPDITPNKFIFSYKYVPPPPSGPVEELFFQLLSLFHPQPFLQSRYGPRGAAAVVRARNIDCLDIWFRLHAEYQLNTPPRLPLWFTPAAFIGRLIINTTDLSIKLFSMHVPKHRALNVDLEWLIGPNEEEDMEVTITHMEEMSVTSGEAVIPDSIIWTQEINAQEAFTMLEKELYKFMEVKYHNFTEAYVRASTESRPVHSLVLWGVLDDQSC